jgi:hypothetical protein
MSATAVSSSRTGGPAKTRAPASRFADTILLTAGQRDEPHGPQVALPDAAVPSSFHQQQ